MSDQPALALTLDHPAILAWRDGVQAIVDADWRERGFDFEAAPLIELDPGRRYVRVWRNRDAGRSGSRTVFAFVDLVSGDILKPDGIAHPAAHARGNLFDATGGLGQIGPYGPAYLR